MKKYALYVESGPRQRKTMVHVLDLLGCIAQGATTAEAIQATPEAIRAFALFLRQHGDSLKLADTMTTVIAEHVMEGSWIGNGDPTSGFTPDFQPLSAKDLRIYLERLTWMRADLLELIGNVPRKQLLAEPKTAGRSIFGIIEHAAEAQGVYLRYLVGKVDGLADALKAVHASPETLPPALTRVWQISNSRLAKLTEVERTRSVPHGQVTWTARRALRRMLEHEWEHMLEIAARLGKPIV